MSPFFDDLEAQLLAAARAQTAGERAPVEPQGGIDWRGWVAVVLRSVPIGLAVLCAVAIAVLAVVLVHHGRRGPVGRSSVNPPAGSSGPVPLLPPHPNPSQRAALALIYGAQETVTRSDPACLVPESDLGNPSRRPSLSRGSPSPSTLAVLGVLRRPAVASDKLPPRLIGAPPNQRVYPDGTIPPVKSVYVGYIRKARHRYGANYYVVPAGDINFTGPIPARCYRLQESALTRDLAHAAARVRRGTLGLERRYVAQMRHNALPYPGVCLLALNGTGNGDGGCGAGGSLAQIENGQAVAGGAPTGVEVYYGLAPDGVRSITFSFDSKYVHHPVSALVINNVFIVRNYRGRLGPIAREIWRAPDGRIIRVIHPP
jgi:hypothetical protein